MDHSFNIYNLFRAKVNLILVEIVRQQQKNEYSKESLIQL